MRSFFANRKIEPCIKVALKTFESNGLFGPKAGEEPWHNPARSDFHTRQNNGPLVCEDSGNVAREAEIIHRVAMIFSAARARFCPGHLIVHFPPHRRVRDM